MNDFGYNKETVLGLDLGPSSIGWALLEKIPDPLEQEEDYYPGSRIIDMGVRIFEAGKEAFGTAKEKSKCEDRRTSRGMRRRAARLARRKDQMRAACRELGLNLDNLETDSADPYRLRARGLDEKLTPAEFVRCLYQLCRRRGFWSNRKESTKAKENSDMLTGANGLRDAIQTSGCRTVGEYFDRMRTKDPLARIRNKTGEFQFLIYRDLAKQEYNALWDAQNRLQENDELWNRLMTPEVRKKLERIIFFQRDMYWRKSVIGRCELEPNELRAPRADRRAQEFRILQEINNLAWIDNQAGTMVKLGDGKHADLWNILYEKLLNNKELSFEQIRKALGLPEDVQFNLGKEGRGKLKGMETDAVLRGKKFFGKDWDKKSDDQKNEIVRILLERPIDPSAPAPKADEMKAGKSKNQDLVKSMSDDDLIRYAQENWGVSEETAQNLAEESFPAGYGSLSVKALEKLLPPLRKGLVYMANDDSDSALHAAGYLRRDQVVRTALARIPLLEERPSNPIVNRVISETRRLINDIVGYYGLPDKIHIELAREVKVNQIKRMEDEKVRRDNRKEREMAKEKLEEKEIKDTAESNLKYRLWQSQRGISPYSGDPISFEQLFNGQTDIDHIIPYSQSMDDSQSNKVVCFRSENAAKGQRSPVEWLKEGAPERYEAMLQRVRDYPYQKRLKFMQTEIPDGFSERQLNDTKYASRLVAQMVEQLYGSDGHRHVLCTKGKYTALLRQNWGLNRVLNNDDFLSRLENRGEKNRNDHRHHAIDALVIALTDAKLLNYLGRNWLKKKPLTDRSTPKFSAPWAGFFQDAAGQVNQIIVSHRPVKRVRGSLHEDSNYGPVFDRQGNQEEGFYVIRKPIINLSQKEIGLIRDEKIREMVRQRVFEGMALEGEAIKKPADFSKLMKRLFDGDNALRFNPDDPKSTPIYKVRIKVPNGATVPLRAEKNGGRNRVFVRPGNTHHITMFERKNEKGKTVRELVFCTMLEAYQRKRLQYRKIRDKKQELSQSGLSKPDQEKELRLFRTSVMRDYPVVQHVHPEYPEATFLFTLSNRDSFLVRHKGVEKIVKFTTAPSTTKQLMFRDNRDASRKEKNNGKEINLEFSVSKDEIIKKISVDRLGRIHDSHE